MNKVIEVATLADAIKVTKKICRKFHMWYDVEPYGLSCVDVRTQDKSYGSEPNYTIWFPEEVES
jgi:hypothetical protein